MLSIGQGIYIQRVEKGVTQANLVGKTGIPQPNISNIEKGKQDITVSTLFKICRALEISPSDLLDRCYQNTTRKSVVFQRSLLERIAKAVVHKKKGLRAEEARIADLFRAVLPAKRRKSVRLKEVYRAWTKLRQCLSGEEIRTLLERIQDEKQRAA